jgi:hypothetical protein
MRRQIVEKFQGVVTEIINRATRGGDKRAKLNVAVAIYLATYFDSNESGVAYLQKYRSDENFAAFY